MTDTMTVGLVGAGGAIFGGLVNGVYQHVVNIATRPRLEIDYLGSKGGNFVETDSLIYVRARIRNTGRRIARSCRVFLTGLKEVHASGATTATAYHDSLTVAWAGWKHAPQDVPAGVQFFADVFWVSKNDAGWKFSTENMFDSHRHLLTYKGTYRFRLTVTADNAAPVSCEIDATYHGDWHDLRALQFRG